jgi:DNA primase large subunit
LSLEDALLYWKAEFTKAMSVDDFEKSYAYNIRHSYGREGKKADYTPYGCTKMIMGDGPQGDETHGCPYKHAGREELMRMLHADGIAYQKCEEIIALRDENHFQIACKMHFSLRHPKGEEVLVQHPNQYFEASKKYHSTHKQE